MTNKNVLFILLVFISSLYLTACSDTPRAGQLIDGVNELVVNTEYESIFMIRNIRKTNGYMLEKMYHAEMEYDRLCLVNVNDAIKMLDGNVQASKSDNIFDDLSKSLYSLASQSGLLKAGLVDRYGNFQSGDIIKEKITLKFLKTEQGWRHYIK